jgi:hypothetical protein
MNEPRMAEQMIGAILLGIIGALGARRLPADARSIAAVVV